MRARYLFETEEPPRASIGVQAQQLPYQLVERRRNVGDQRVAT
jgi:hypothetical protein